MGESRKVLSPKERTGTVMAVIAIPCRIIRYSGASPVLPMPRILRQVRAMSAAPTRAAMRKPYWLRISKTPLCGLTASCVM